MSTKGHTLVGRIDTHFHVLPQFWADALINNWTADVGRSGLEL